jgi:AbrB family looped-hinge helix DNA binding protein
MNERLMNTVKVGEKGQIVIPKEIRDLLGIKTGDSLLILADKDRGIAIPKKADMEKIAKDILDHES